MQLTKTALYSLRLTFNPNTAQSLYRKAWMDRGSVASAIVLATAGLSLSMFSVRQMQSSQQPLRRLRRLE